MTSEVLFSSNVLSLVLLLKKKLYFDILENFYINFLNDLLIVSI